MRFGNSSPYGEKEYDPKLVGCNEKELLERKIARTARQLQILNEKLENVA